MWLRQVRLLFSDINLYSTQGPDIGLLCRVDTVPVKDTASRPVRKRTAEMTAAHEAELREMLMSYTDRDGTVDWVGLIENGELLRDLEPRVLRETAKKWKKKKK